MKDASPADAPEGGAGAEDSKLEDETDGAAPDGGDEAGSESETKESGDEPAPAESKEGGEPDDVNITVEVPAEISFVSPWASW